MPKKKATGKGNGSGKKKLMEVHFINASGGGFAEAIEVESGCTAAEFFEDMMEGAKPANHLIMINRQPVLPEELIHDGDRVSITPVSVKGS